jgi:glycerol-3-phosphate dehydrogenase
MDRNENLQRIASRDKPWDIVVIGGGATGVGCALDAASRGLDVLLVEQHDFGKGTSSRSTKLVHGGVRYLRQGNVSLVREALRERGLLLRNAPHVVHAQEFIIPCYGVFDKLFYGIGLKIYDLLVGGHSMGRSRFLSRAETIRRLPTVKKDGLTGGVLYVDGQFDDTRLLIDMAITADEHGACLVNYAPAAALRKLDDGGFEIDIRDAEAGNRMTVRSHAVINAAGIFCDGVRRLADSDAAATTTFSQGVHIVLDRSFLPGDAAIMIPKTSDARVLFCIPWLDHTLIGTTDTPVATADLEPAAFETEIDFVIETAAGYLTKRPTRVDILSCWAGIRPLVSSSKTKNTAKLSRSHDLFVDTNGLVTITGGKWTTYRRMAEDAVDRAIDTARLERCDCTTETLQITRTDDDNIGEPLHNDLPYTKADVVRAVRDEMACTVEDVLARRTRALFLNARAAVEIAPRVAAIMAELSDRDEFWVNEQIDHINQLAEGYAKL